jgi:hypothetical protein
VAGRLIVDVFGGLEVVEVGWATRQSNENGVCLRDLPRLLTVLVMKGQLPLDLVADVLHALHLDGI